MHEYDLSTDTDRSFSFLLSLFLANATFYPSLNIIKTLFLSTFQISFSSLLLPSFRLTYLPSRSYLPYNQPIIHTLLIPFFLYFFLPYFLPSLLCTFSCLLTHQADMAIKYFISRLPPSIRHPGCEYTVRCLAQQSAF